MLSISALRNNDNQISGFLGIACDISKRKQAEDKLQDTLRELAFQKFALDQSAIVAVTDLDGKITYANSKFCEISGYSQDELSGKNHRFINSAYHPPNFLLSYGIPSPVEKYGVVKSVIRLKMERFTGLIARSCLY